ncbi:MAG TPA: DUF6734 family protein [Blastocatellia bacterium]|nr:DUF6734 family protein [Blastocatellia bacterium]
MRAVWSFWSKPYFAGWSRWYSDWHHWLGWGLSLHRASQFYPDTCLVTDDTGARILIERLQLPFVHVSTALNRIRNDDADWWSLGKIEAYRLQVEPFVHVDADVFLWKRFAPEVERADVFAQNPEPITPGATLYTPEEVERVIGNGWLPKEWSWYRGLPKSESQCCGVFGGNRIDFIKHYANTALRIIRDPRNRSAMRGLAEKSRHMMLIEQYVLTACVEYHRRQKRSRYGGIELRHVFATLEEALSPYGPRKAGFTHLAGGAKRSPRVSRDLQTRVQNDLPEFYARCTNLLLGSLTGTPINL